MIAYSGLVRGRAAHSAGQLHYLDLLPELLTTFLGDGLGLDPPAGTPGMCSLIVGLEVKDAQSTRAGSKNAARYATYPSAYERR